MSDLDKFSELKLSQLELLHNSNLLVFTRERFTIGLAKRFRPEFNRVFLTNELKDTIKMIAKYNNDNSEATPIDCVRYAS